MPRTRIDKNTESSQKINPDLASPETKPKLIKYVVIGIIFILLIVLPSFSFSDFTGVFNNKVDDWQYQGSRMSSINAYNPDGGFNPIKLIKSLSKIAWNVYQNWSIGQRTFFIVIISLVLLIPYGWKIFHYRIWLAIINLFRKTKIKVKTAITGGQALILNLFGLAGIALLGFLTYSPEIEGFKFLRNNVQVLAAGVITAVNITLLAMVFSLFYTLFLIIKVLTRKDKQSKTRVKKKLGLTASVFIPTYLIVLFIPLVLSLYPSLFGVRLNSYNSPASTGGGGFSDLSSGSSMTNPSISLDSASRSGGGEDNIGFSTGGAKDVNNFRRNIDNDYLPIPTDITHEGLFYDYYFQTGQQEQCDILFCPSYSYAVSKDPISDQEEKYLSVGLNSNIKKTDFQRKKLNLVIVLDISGSMGSGFSTYYYDQFVNRPTVAPKEENKTKMQVANESVNALLDHLNPDDSFGMVLFNQQAFLAKPLRELETTEMSSLKNHIMEIYPQGGTNMEAGYKQAVSMLQEYKNSDKSEYENRIIFITDAQPNTGALSEESLFGMTESNAADGIFTTFIGVGVDFNTELTEKITKIEGANYYSVHSPTEFKERMDKNFEYMVTPLVFDLRLVLESNDYDIAAVYGSPEANKATGEIMYVNTLFPSDSQQGEVKGGIILLKLDPQQQENDQPRTAQLKVSYRDRQGQEYQREKQIQLDGKQPPNYDNNGIRKAVVLSRYVNLAKNWIKDERAQTDEYREIKVIDTPSISTESGIIVMPDEFKTKRELSRWERTSLPLKVHSPYGEYFDQFYTYFDQEKQALGDETMDQELKILEKLKNQE